MALGYAPEIGRSWLISAYRGGVALFGEITLLKRYRVGLVTGALRTTAFPQEFAGRAAKFADRLLLPSAAEHHVSLR